MARALVFTGGETTTNAGATAYEALANVQLEQQTVEANRQVIWRTGGVISNLFVNISSNGIAGLCTVGTRNNGSDGNMSVSIGVGQTGQFEDNTHTDTITAGNKYNYKKVTGGGGFGGTLVQKSYSVVFTPTSNTAMKHSSTGRNPVINTASTTFYLPLSGDGNVETTTEVSDQINVNSPGTLKNLHLYISANARTTSTTFGSRVNGGAGNLSVSVGATSTGDFEDTSNSDSIALDDEVNYYCTTGTGTENLTWHILASVFETTNNKFMMIGANSTAFSLGTTQQYFSFGQGVATTVESEARADMNVYVSLTNLFVHISSNTHTGTKTILLRKNGVDGNNIVSISASSTGVFEDTTSIDIFSPDDEFCLTHSGGTSGASVLTIFGITCENTQISVATYMQRIEKVHSQKTYVVGYE